MIRMLRYSKIKKGLFEWYLASFTSPHFLNGYVSLFLIIDVPMFLLCSLHTRHMLCIPLDKNQHRVINKRAFRDNVERFLKPFFYLKFKLHTLSPQYKHSLPLHYNLPIFHSAQKHFNKDVINFFFLIYFKLPCIEWVDTKNATNATC